MIEQRQGDWMQTFTGRRFWPFDPHPGDIDIRDVAHALALLCRFGGHCREFYSVAQHCVHVSECCPHEDALWGLLHDASEAYLVDVPRPIKRAAGMETYVDAESRIQWAVCKRFGLPLNDVGWPEAPSSVHIADEALLATEARDLMGNAALETWCLRQEPLDCTLEPWKWQDAEARFLARYRYLTGD